MPKLRPIHYKTLVRLFELEGFRQRRQEGDHLILGKPGLRRPVVIPKYRDVPVFIIKNNLRAAGMRRERYFELLRRCK